MQKDEIEIFYPASQAEWRLWLQQNHFFKKAVWLSNYNSSYYAFKAIGEYLEKCNNFILEKGILFLNDIYQYEESDFMIQGAEQVVKNLKQTFSERAKKDAQADIKVQIIKKSAKTILR